MVYGIGIDLVENERIEKVLLKWGEKFLQRVFSEAEVIYCSRHAQASLHYGARFAAKESFLKAMGIGLGMGVLLREIEVINDRNGKPGLVLSGGADREFKKKEITNMHLSLTHTNKFATAVVLLEINKSLD